MAALPRTVQPPGSQLPRQSTTFPPGNPYTPPIPQPAEDLPNLAACVSALKLSVESLSGQRGDATNRAVTFNDLVSYGVLSPMDVNSPSGGSISDGSGGVLPSEPAVVWAVGSGLVLDAGTDPDTLSLATPVTIVHGGTGSATAPAALTALGAASLAYVDAGDEFLQDQIDDIATGGGVGTITGVSAGTGLTGGGTAGGVTLALVIPVAIAHGGTNATTPGAALANLGGAPLNSPLFTGDPRAPTPLPTDIDNSIATTAWVVAAVGADELIDGGNF